MRFDSLLVHYLARELDRRLGGAAARAIRLDPASLVAALETDAGTLLLDLHPSRGWILLGAPPPAAVVLPLHRRSRVRRVSAPADERILVLELEGGSPTRVQRLVVELMGNQWNALALDGSGRVVALLRPRQAGNRRLRVGAIYQPPPAAGRQGTETPLAAGSWQDLLGTVPPPERERKLIEAVAWTSPLNAAALLGSAAEDASATAAEAAYGRYRSLAERPEAQPCLLDVEAPGATGQPYPLPLPGRAVEPVRSLLDAMAEVAGSEPQVEDAPAGSTSIDPQLLDRLRRICEALERRVDRLRAQAAGAGTEASALRAHGAVLLANLRAIRKGDARVTLQDFTGGSVEIELDPALSPADNATRLYEQALRRDHAAARVPGIIAGVEAERGRLLELLRRATVGEATEQEVTAAMDRSRPSPRTAAEERLPYRSYRTSGGLEVRVGRTRKDNDDLTFHHSAPNDVWLHARDVAGAHVLLRWSDPAGSPPHRDLTEAAVLAALHSRARTSGTVAVDWTRRKYVRKPRKAPPGLVVPERVRTIFVEPDERVERALRPPG